MQLSGQLPDFRNLGICLRILIVVNLIAIMAISLHASSFEGFFQSYITLSALLQPVLLVTLLVLYFSYPLLRKLPYWLGTGIIIFTALCFANAARFLAAHMFEMETLPAAARVWLYTLILAGITLYYFHLRQRALTPAIAEARLQALQARIRPHFLFNCINAVLSLVRSDPRRAETALEDMADLFRVLMADNRGLVPLAKEIALCRQYLALEKLRLDERLAISWQIDEMPPDAMIPPLILQPLLENAVYHGIEPLPEGGEIVINIHTSRNGSRTQVIIVLCNPYPKQGSHHNGNRMALGNIRERLALHFDAEASLSNKVSGGRYEVRIAIPYQQNSILLSTTIQRL